MANVDPAEIAVALARIEGKLDLQNAQALVQASRSDDHEARIRQLEARATVTPKQLAGWLSLGLAVVSTAAPFVIFSLR